MDVKLCLTLACGALVFPGAAVAKPHHRHHKAHKTHKGQGKRDTPTPRWDHVAGYGQTAGYGGRLYIARSDGSIVYAYFGEKTDLRCGPTANGPFTTCGKENLVKGVPVADAAHGPNVYGNDVWAEVDLVTTPVSTTGDGDGGDGGTTTPPSGDSPHTEPPHTDPPPTPPAPEQHTAPAPTGFVHSYDAASRTLVVDRPTNTEQPSGVLTDTTSINCVLVKNGILDGVKTPCGPADLVPGAPLAGANRSLVDNVWTWTKIYILVPES